MMACEKHGYTNPTFCPACDREALARFDTIPRKRLRELGIPEDLTAGDVARFFSLPDDDDTMHSQQR
jgi:hypothetical protein